MDLQLMSDLTFESMRKMIDDLGFPPRQPGVLDFLAPPKFMGMNVYAAPPPPPVIQVRDIKFDDGTSILPARFRDEVNLWLLKRFGLQEDLFKDRAFLVSGMGLVVSPRHAVMLANIV
jgi:hypothetical protein